MIHNVLLLTKNGIKLFHRSYWAIEVDQTKISEFIGSLHQLERDAGQDVQISIFIDNMKFAYNYLESDLLLVLVSDPQDKDEILQEKLDAATKLIKQRFAAQITTFRQTKDSSVFQDLAPLIDAAVVSTLKIVLLGQGGVGKSTILKMLLGRRAELEHFATLAVNVEQIEKSRLGPYEIACWDFPGQEKMVPVWQEYLKGTDVVLLITDSTLKDVMATRKMLPMIRKHTPGALIWAIANKQDLKDSIPPVTVQRLLGVRTIGLVAIDPRNKELLFKTLMGAAAEATAPIKVTEVIETPTS